MFKSDIVVARRMNESGIWEVRAPLIWDDGNVHITVPVGFRFDFATTPQWIWSILPRSGMKYDRAAALHDWLYGTYLLTRKEADVLFYEAMRYDGVGYVRASFMYKTVRIFGGRAWNNQSLHEVNKNRLLGDLPLLKHKDEAKIYRKNGA